MSIQRYKKTLIPFILVLLLMIVMSIPMMSGDNPPPFSGIPGDSSGVQALILFALYIFIPILGVLIFGYLLGPAFLLLHKKTIGRKMEYGIQEKQKPAQFKKYFAGLFPALLAINLSLMLATNPTAWHAILSDEYFAWNMKGNSLFIMLTFMGLVIYTLMVAFFVFVPVWFLIDSGIVYTNQAKVKDTTKPTEIRGVGSWFQYFLKGYAGISVIFSYYSTAIWMIQEQAEGPTIILLPIYPLVITFSCLPAIIVMDITYESRKKFMLKWAKKFGVIKKVDIVFKEVE